MPHIGHLVRAGVLIVLLLVFTLVGLRVLPVPEFLTGFGFHDKNTEENQELWASLPIQYVASYVCVDCHEEKYQMWETGNHRTVSCESCHGPARAHVGTMAQLIIESSRGLCGRCHAELVSRPGDFPQVDMADMGGEAECVTCHDPHEPRAGMPPEVPHSLEPERANCELCHSPQEHEPWLVIPPQVPHALEGRGDCQSCHGPHGVRGESLPHIPHSLEGRGDCLLCHNVGGIRPLPEDHVGRTTATCLNCHRSE